MNSLKSKQPPLERFWSKVQRGRADDCWPWRGLKDHRGRPAFYLRAKERTTAARALWKMLHGDPGRQVIRHLCENIECVNPAHLVLADRAGHGSPPGERATNAKLTEAQAREILAARGKVTAKELAVQYGVSIHTVKTIWRGQTWKHLQPEEEP